MPPSTTCRPWLASARQREAYLFSSLALLNDKVRREYLDRLKPADMASDEEFRKGRDIGREFDAALRQLFFDTNDQLRTLTMTYGVF